jgi:hypothetical protein
MPEGLADRGIGWQATGFTLTGIACLVILKSYDGSNFWLYQWFETATVDLYWSFVVPLAALFDGGRKLFEKGKAIREAQKARMVQKARQEEQKRIQKALTKHGVALSPEVTEAVFGDSSQNAS